MQAILPATLRGRRQDCLRHYPIGGRRAVGALIFGTRQSVSLQADRS